ncbi:MAG: S8 family serine peptidase, partial [Gammaproteobacteria bacterium]|nr:S8 family serine peptidase [Gammaproteobacteria bacterium]
PTATDPWTEVAYYDFLFGLETSTYAPNGGVPVGEWGLEVCAYAGQDPIGPATYTGSLTWNDANIGPGDFCYGGVVEDANQHGSHTASTAAGNYVSAPIVAPTITINKDMSGVAPHASLITYAGCLPEGGCLGLSLVNAIEQIVVDGVDVANYSIGGGASNAWNDSDSLGFLSAREAGIWVATSASNDGPGAGSIGSPADAPWITTVGASTHNRVINNTLENMTGGDTAAPANITGKGLTAAYPVDPLQTASIVYAGDYPATGDPLADPALCAGGDAAASTNPWTPGTFNGEIVVCDRGTYARVDKCKHAGDAGAGGCILANHAAAGDSLVADGHSYPAVHITYDDGVVLKAWLASGTGHVGRITGSVFDLDPIFGDVEAGFSSRGPNRNAPNNLKPDVTNPGVDILAAINTAGNTNPDPTNGEFGSLSGTSMSSPHTAGSYALLKAKRPELSPHEAQSALMMTSTREFTKDSNGSDAGDPFDRGAGRVDLTRAAKAGLVMSAKDMNNPGGPEYGGSSSDAMSLNIPSFSSANCGSTGPNCTWTREVKSVASVPVTWTAGFTSEDGVTVTVTPNQFTLAPGATQVITVSADITSAQPATPQGPAGPGEVNESQHFVAATDTAPAQTFPQCFTSTNGRDHDCWVFADISLTSSEPSVPDVSMPLAARSTGDADGDGIKDLVDNCPTVANPSQDPADDDTDGVPNACDNCLNVANPSQCDTNGDGFGNHCDADLNNNGITNSFDLNIMRSNFGSTSHPDSDLNCNGITNSFDLVMMRNMFGQPPGPSGLNP